MVEHLVETDLPSILLQGKGKKVEVRVVDETKEKSVSFTMMGNGVKNNVGKSIDVIEVCAELNKGEHRVLKFFRDKYIENCKLGEEFPHIVTPTQCEDFDKRLEIDLKKNFTHMHYLGVFRRVKKGTYMINPNLIISTTNYMKILAKWESLVKEVDDN